MTLEAPHVSIIIPVFNSEKFIQKTIESVIAQTYSDWEIIAINDGSTDKSLEILNKYKQELPSKIHVINQKNSGPSSTRNKGITEAKGKYIAFLDSDDLWMLNKLEKQVEFLESDKEIGLLFSDCYVIEGNRIINGKSYLERSKPFRGKIFNHLFYNNFIPTSTAIVRKDVLKEVGLFNQQYKISQDYDLWLRIAENYSVDFLDELLAEYRFHNEGISRNVELMINEDFNIMQYWLNTKPELKKKLNIQIKQKRTRLHYQLALYYYHNFKIMKASQEFVKWGYNRINILRD